MEKGGRERVGRVGGMGRDGRERGWGKGVERGLGGEWGETVGRGGGERG